MSSHRSHSAEDNPRRGLSTWDIAAGDRGRHALMHQVHRQHWHDQVQGQTMARHGSRKVRRDMRAAIALELSPCLHTTQAVLHCKGRKRVRIFFCNCQPLMIRHSVDLHVIEFQAPCKDDNLLVQLKRMLRAPHLHSSEAVGFRMDQCAA